MKKLVRFLVVMIVLFPAIVSSQNPSLNLMPSGFPTGSSPGQDSENGSFMSSLPILKEFKAGKVLINPSVSVGYQHLTSNMNLPASTNPRGASQLFIGPMDVTLQDLNFWYGTAGLNILIDKVTLFGSLGGYSPRLFQMKGTIPISNDVSYVAPNLMMTGSNLNFWTAQCGAGYTISGGFSLLAGYLWTHTAATFSDPRVESIPLANQTLTGDVSMDVGVPFVGLQILEKGFYRGALMYSPLATSSGTLSLNTISPQMSDISYTLNQPGNFFAVNAEYFFMFKPPVILSCWFLGTYLNIRGNSDLQFTAPGFNSMKDVTITNTQYGLAGGATFALIF